jgi:hypothetical protein
LAAAAQTPPDTNAAPGQPGDQPQVLQTNVQTNANPVLWPALTNQFGLPSIPTQPGVLTNTSNMTGPTSPGSGVIGSPLMGTSSFGGPPVFAGANGPSGPGLLRWGPFDFHPYVGYSFMSETGIGSQPGQHTGSTVNTVSEGLSVNMGSHWNLNYGASTAFYSGSDYTDTTSQFVSLHGSTAYKDWTFGLSQDYSFSSTPLVETGTQTEQEAYVTVLNASHQLSDKLSFYIGANQTFRFTTEFDNVEEWSGSSGLNYQIVPQLSVGLSANGGYDGVSQGTSIEFEQLQGVISFHPGPKLSLNLSGGAEEQQFVGANTPGLLTPTFSASAGYVLSASTVISIVAARTVSPSFYVNEDNVTTSVSGAIQQRLTRRLGLSLSGGYMTADFTSIEPGPLPPFYVGIKPTTELALVRSDRTTFVGASLHYAFTSRLTSSAYYNFSQNSSSEGNFAYSSSQVGVQLSYRY